MRHFTILLFLSLLLSNSVLSQSIKSDSLFAIGISCYQNEEYEKAISYFMKCDSIDVNDNTLDDSRKSYSKMWVASSYYKQGQEELPRVFHRTIIFILLLIEEKQ